MATYVLPHPLPWPVLAGPLAAAEDALARLDERLSKSPIRDGWIARTHLSEACASLWCDGDLVHLEDLVLHDVHMDTRTPTHELTRAATVLQARRRLVAAAPAWALSLAGLSSLRQIHDQEGPDPGGAVLSHSAAAAPARATAHPAGSATPGAAGGGSAARDPLADAFADIDAALHRVTQTLAGAEPAPRPEPPSKHPLVYDPDWDDAARLADWSALVAHTARLPPTLAAAVALDAWTTLAPLQHAPWLGRQLAAALLRQRGKTRVYLPGISLGLQALARDRKRPAAGGTGLLHQLEALAAGAAAGLADHHRWVTARDVLARQLRGRRDTSHLPALIDLLMRQPVVSAGMIAEALGITPRAAQNLVATLGLRELTGRGRYRAWGIL